MGKKVRKQAEASGLKNQKHTILYARARKFRTTFSKYVPDCADAIRDYLTLQDSTLLQGKSGGGRNSTYYYLAPQIHVYVELLDKTSGFAVVNPSNHAIQINIWTDNEDYVRGIANAVNSCWADADGILAHMDWKKIEKKYKVNRDDCIAEWKKWL
ncbi:MAG: hypothetical protein ACTSRS_08410 [Candidatus Helarchaeota archaeon]